MSRKTHFAGVAALAVGLATIAGNTELSGANAQATEATPSADVAAPLVEETVPKFVAQEVVQPLPEAEAPAAETEVEAESLAQLVARLDAPAQLSRQMECLAGAIYFESRGEPLAGQLAVAQVVINRAESDLFPSDYCGVVYQRSQFSFVKGGRMPSIKRRSLVWQQAVKIARIAHEGLWDSAAGDALYFHANYVKPKWSYRKQALATISTHIFYR
ncbi:cell wall hydrolase [Erythrobacter sp. SDW2]|uniref:cell wall hydrolase n=1 Tax=Erythrobacter sp. SDW2 TaxID=2907154 RepID=UPI001F30550C|nr:cell wall hydrolase [Erythrobacter sp. SDW2]UIP07298.1 cell wall hydrolase [Erythrobacter sp. SDW2]